MDVTIYVVGSIKLQATETLCFICYTGVFDKAISVLICSFGQQVALQIRYICIDYT